MKAKNEKNMEKTGKQLKKNNEKVSHFWKLKKTKKCLILLINKMKSWTEIVKFGFPELSPELRDPLGGPEQIAGFRGEKQGKT